MTDIDPTQSFKARFYVNGEVCKLKCKPNERFEAIKERIWKKMKFDYDLVGYPDRFMFKLKNSERTFKDFETFQRLIAVFVDDPEARIEAVLVPKHSLPEVETDGAHLGARIQDDGTVHSQGYLDRLNRLSPDATTTRRYWLLQDTTLFFYASENAYYQKEHAIGSYDVNMSQVIQIKGLNQTFQVLRPENDFRPGQLILKAPGDLAYKVWVQAFRRNNYRRALTKGLTSLRWVPDEIVTDCMRCESKFGMAKRKHHCRTCGTVICSDCSKNKIQLPDDLAKREDRKEIRVCNPCYKDWRKKKVDLNASGIDNSLKAAREKVEDLMGVEGYLLKQSRRGLKPWQQRWFVLDEKKKSLVYYKDKQSRTLGKLGEIRLADVKEAYHVKGDRLRFDVVTGKKTYAFQAEKPNLSTRWVTHINRLVRQGKTGNGLEAGDDLRSGSSSSPKNLPPPPPVGRKASLGMPPAPKAKTPPTSGSSAPEANNKILMRGMLKKRKPNTNRFLQHWQDRYFTLDATEGKLFYYKKDPQEVPGELPAGSIDLIGVTMCKVDPVEQSKPKFSVMVNTGRQYQLATKTAEEATKWVAAISSVTSSFKAESMDESSNMAFRKNTLRISDQAESLAAPSLKSPNRVLRERKPEIREQSDDSEEEGSHTASKRKKPGSKAPVEEDDDETPPPPPPPSDPPPPTDPGWPQLEAHLDNREMTVNTLAILGFLPATQWPAARNVCMVWRVIIQALMAQKEEGSGSDDSDEGGGAEEEFESSGEDDEEEASDDSGDDEKFPPIVIDNGTCWIRVGFAGERKPRFMLEQTAAWTLDPTQVASRSAAEGTSHFVDTKDTWKALEKCFKVAFTQLGVDPKQHKVLVTQPMRAPMYIRRNLERVLFMRFKVPAVYVAEGPILVCYSYGTMTGLVIDVGETAAQVVPIYEGHIIDAAVRRATYLGGEASTRKMYAFLQYTSLSSLDPVEAFKVAQKVKEKYCFVARDFEAALKDTAKSKKCVLPGGEEISLQRALPSVGEIYFNPAQQLQDKEMKSLPELVADSVESCDMDTRRDILSWILLAGGDSMLPGLPERLEKGIGEAMPYAAEQMRLRYDRSRKNAVWNGGSVLAKLEMFQKNWVEQANWVASQPAEWIEANK
eukprot:gb/GEZN01000568.1/.p1 GENE.gb/GEZN01000568.1/~~gb/GEZN01000568.1/.p1  ORF type:complete len:1133 (-),score=177.16 gb/GEZN01000568.1/:591-3989(-)